MFYGDLETKIPAPKPIERSAGGPEALKKAADLLLSAKNPVIVSGLSITLTIITRHVLHFKLIRKSYDVVAV